MPLLEVFSSPEAATSRPRRRRRKIPSLLSLFLFLAFLSLLAWNYSSILFAYGGLLSMETNDEKAIAPQSSLLTSNTTTVVKPRNDTRAVTAATTISRETSRKVEFLNKSDFGSDLDKYSGMWWQNRTVFLSRWNSFKHIKSLEAASFAKFRMYNGKNGGGGGVRLTRDWLDMSVEHLSSYFKHLNKSYKNQRAIRERLVEIMQNYIDNVVGYPNISSGTDELAVHSTIAILPLTASAKEPDNEMMMFEMAATIASLWKVGIGRAIVVGVSEREQKLAQDTFAMLRVQLAIRPMELAYVQVFNTTAEDRRLVPRVALFGLQNVMHPNNTDSAAQQAWLGSDPSRWKYVYFTEPDLILHTRPSALPAISQVLKEGSLMAAHRLDPVPHQRDIPQTNTDDYRFVLPNNGSFAAITPLGENDVCCDQGRYYPGNHADPTQREKVVRACPWMTAAIWFYCGFARKDKDYKDPAVILDVHHRLLKYPFISLSSGTGLPVLSEHQRVCVPRHGPANCADD